MPRPIAPRRLCGCKGLISTGQLCNLLTQRRIVGGLALGEERGGQRVIAQDTLGLHRLRSANRLGRGRRKAIHGRGAAQSRQVLLPHHARHLLIGNGFAPPVRQVA